MPSAAAALIHHGERSSTANSEFSAIFHFMPGPLREPGCAGAARV